MKTLLVLRHAKAERESDGGGDDFDRPLAPRGWRDAEKIGRQMREHGLKPELLIASPAKRAEETVVAVARGYGALAPQTDPRIYQASADELLNIVRQADKDAATLMLVGHNPGLQELILRLADDDRDLCAQVAGGFPTSALAMIELPVASWRDEGERIGRLVRLITPRDLD